MRVVSGCVVCVQRCLVCVWYVFSEYAPQPAQAFPASARVYLRGPLELNRKSCLRPSFQRDAETDSIGLSTLSSPDTQGHLGRVCACHVACAHVVILLM